MRPDTIVLLPPLLSNYPNLLKDIEDLSIQQLISKPAIEALNVSVLPRASRSDEEPSSTSPCEPASKRVDDELRTVVRTDVNRNPVDLEQNTKRFMNVRRGEAPADLQSETPSSELVDDHEDLHPATVHGLLCHEVIAPDMARIFRSMTNASLFRATQSKLLSLSLRHLQALQAPQALDPLVIDLPSSIAKPPRDARRSPARLLPSDAVDLIDHTPFARWVLQPVPLRRSRLLEKPASPPLGDTMSSICHLD